jgi:hypothetical protein
MSPYTHTSLYENSHQEFSEFTYSSYQPLHPGGATHYKILASNVSLCLMLPLICLLSIQICSRNPLTILNPVEFQTVSVGVL